MSWLNREYKVEQPNYPLAPLPSSRGFPTPPHVPRASKPRHVSVDELRRSAATRTPHKRRMSDISGTPGTQASDPAGYSNNPNASPSASLSGASLRKERGAIAAQACDTCRSRKQRCDEQRPKCGTCQKFRLECNYREPQPTKKDKTLVEILDRIRNLEGKIDSLTLRPPISPATAYPAPPNSLPSPLPATQTGLDPPVPTTSSYHFPDVSSVASGGADEQYQYVSSVHQMLKWPAIQQLFASIQPKIPNIDLSMLEREGPASMVALRRAAIQSLPAETERPVGRSSSIRVHGAIASQLHITIADLNWDTMQRLGNAYFDTLNLLCPILSRQSFMGDTLPTLFNHGFSNNMASTIAFLVFALGEVAIAGTEGPPVHIYNGRASGIKGGTSERPPGLNLFNEARRRMGFNLTECTVENVQIFELASLYYGTCFYPLDFWRMTTSASMACQALITSHPSILNSPTADLTRRAFWHCSVMETGLNLELGFPLTGLERMESVVGLPDFSGPYSDDDYMSNQESYFQEHFASQIVLRRLLVDFHSALNQGNPGSTSLSQISTPFSPTSTLPGPNQVTIRQLALQLEQWRGMLPQHLRWQEDAPGSFPNGANTDPYSATASSLFTPAATPMTSTIPTAVRQPQAQAPGQTPPMFSTDLDAPPPRYSHVLDVQVALLRSRYYYTKYLIHRPFVYKALHHPDSMANEDAIGVAECLKATLKWPVAMSPTCRNKRLVPCSFFFTQNFLGILVLLHLTTTVPILRRIRDTLCGERFEIDAGETVGLYMDWLRDLKAVDDATTWHWEVVKGIYGLEE